MIDAMEEVGGLDRATCRRSVEGRFDIDRMVGDYEALCGRVAQRRVRPPARLCYPSRRRRQQGRCTILAPGYLPRRTGSHDACASAAAAEAFFVVWRRDAQR
jgi:hypothetical protein